MSLPSREAILAFVAEAQTPVGKREIARAFGLKGEAKAELKALLQAMEEEGALAHGRGRQLHRAGHLPRVAVLKVVSGGARPIAEPELWDRPEVRPRVKLAPGQRGLAPGDRVLTRIEERADGYHGRPIKKLGSGHVRVLGLARQVDGALRLQPVDRRLRRDMPLRADRQIEPGTLVAAEVSGQGGRAVAHLVEELGDPLAPRSLSLIAIEAKGIPHQFSGEALAEAEAAAQRPLGARTDLAHLPFLTIDPEDARDHDDAVWAEATDWGFRLSVAIADVSWYVQPGSALDRAAFERGNSVYFPDRVVPMLPEALSADACSLKAGTDKAVMVCHMELGRDGAVRAARFERARIRVSANLAYAAAQAAMQDAGDATLRPLLEPLWGAWGALMKARARRAPLELDLPERQVRLDADGNIAGVHLRARLDAHRVIEEMMIAANVAAAEALEARKASLLFRCHETPGREKMLALKEYLETLGMSLALGQVVTPSTFNRVLARAEGRPEAEAVAEQVLRTQTQAYYAPRNTGHFGLALASYAHFTSPIRRYADVIVHRALVAALGLGAGGLPAGSETRLPAIGEHVSLTERRAMEAERETLDRYVAKHLSSRLGEVVDARVTGVTAFGLFATVEGVGGDGLLPAAALGDEYFHFDAAARALVGERSGTRFATGQRLRLRLVAAETASGALGFALPDAGPLGPMHARRGAGRSRSGRHGRPPRG
jgi:ribonuclease R